MEPVRAVVQIVAAKAVVDTVPEDASLISLEDPENAGIWEKPQLRGAYSQTCQQPSYRETATIDQRQTIQLKAFAGRRPARPEGDP